MALSSLAALLFARPALAHGFGQRYDLPVPLWLYLWAASAVVLLSFVLVSYFVGKEEAPRRYPRFDLLRLRAFRATLASRPFVSGLRLLSVTLFALVVASGLSGDQTPELNFAPTFVWIWWWVGLTLFVALVGNVWPLVNPWKILFEWADGLTRRLGVEEGLELRVPYPAAWDVWPALACFAAFAWVELVFWGSATPRNIALFALLYSSVTWAGMTFFGKETWLRRGEAFSVLFDILARFAPTEARVKGRRVCEGCEECVPEGRSGDEPSGGGCGGCVNCWGCFERAAPGERELDLRPPGVGLLDPERFSAGRLVFVVFVLASVTYDGLLATPQWVALVYSLSATTGSVGMLGSAAYGTLGLVVVPLVFLGLYAGVVKLCAMLGKASFATLAGAFAYSLVPIALVYQAAHYFTYLLTEGQLIFALVSDPFGWGWDLFGTAGYEPRISVVDAAFVWYSQVALIVGGHVFAVYLAHAAALRQMPDARLALRSQYPMVALMILYTVLGLWILSQPVAG
ncbi:MAG TPA: hypothetical protein VHH10_08485 [Rubrobacteraceae bacterium]|nr:hypothetical protein [Rubrobacteraceae bacterium]